MSGVASELDLRPLNTFRMRVYKVWQDFLLFLHVWESPESQLLRKEMEGYRRQ